MNSFSGNFFEKKVVVFPVERLDELQNTDSIEWYESPYTYQLVVCKYQIKGKKLVTDCKILSKEFVH